MGDAFFRETRDGRYVVALDFYPQLFVRALNFLRCTPSTESINNAILKWDAAELEEAAAAEGLVLAMVRTNEEFRREVQYQQVLSKMPLITVEKIGESDPIPPVSYTHLRAHETRHDLVCRLLLEKKKS